MHENVDSFDWEHLPVDCKRAVIQRLTDSAVTRFTLASRYWQRKALALKRDLRIQSWSAHSAVAIARHRNLDSITFETMDLLTKDTKLRNRLRSLWRKSANPTRLAFLDHVPVASLLAFLPELPPSLKFLQIHFLRTVDETILDTLSKLIKIISNRLINIESLVILPADEFFADAEFIAFLEVISPLAKLPRLREFYFGSSKLHHSPWPVPPALILAHGPKRPGLNLWVTSKSCLSCCLASKAFDRSVAELILNNGADPSILPPLQIPSALASCRTLTAVQFLLSYVSDSVLESIFIHGGLGLISELLSTMPLELLEAVLLSQPVRQMETRLGRRLLGPTFLLDTIEDAEAPLYQDNIEQILVQKEKDLVERIGIDLDAQDHGHGRTLLHWATIKAWPRVVSALNARGANARIRDRNGLLPAEVAISQCENSYTNLARLSRQIADDLLRAAPDVTLPLNLLSTAVDSSLIRAVANIAASADAKALHDLLLLPKEQQEIRFAPLHATMLLHIAAIDQDFLAMPLIFSKCAFTPYELSHPNNLSIVIAQSHKTGAATHVECALRAGAPLALNELQSMRFYLNDEEMIDHVLPFINYAAWTQPNPPLSSAMLFWATAPNHQPSVKMLRTLAEKMFDSRSGMDPQLRTFLITGKYGIFPTIVEWTLQKDTIAGVPRELGMEAIEYLIGALRDSSSDVDWVKLDQETISRWPESTYSVGAKEVLPRLQSAIKPLL